MNKLLITATLASVVLLGACNKSNSSSDNQSVPVVPTNPTTPIVDQSFVEGVWGYNGVLAAYDSAATIYYIDIEGIIVLDDLRGWNYYLTVDGVACQQLRVNSYHDADYSVATNQEGYVADVTYTNNLSIDGTVDTFFDLRNPGLMNTFVTMTYLQPVTPTILNELDVALANRISCPSAIPTPLQ